MSSPLAFGGSTENSPRKSNYSASTPRQEETAALDETALSLGATARKGRSRRLHTLNTVSCSAPEYVNHEQDMIAQSFGTGNYSSIREALPVEIGPGTIHELRRQRQEKNRLGDMGPQIWSKMAQIWGGGWYQDVGHMPDEFSRQEEFEKRERKASLQQRMRISNSDWRCASQEKRCKHESMMSNDKEPFPYLGGRKDDEVNSSTNWLRSTTTTAMSSTAGARSPLADSASFLTGKGRGLGEDSRCSRETLPMMVQRLQTRLSADWDDATVVVNATDQDLIQVAFLLETVDSERGVLAYMGILAKDGVGLRKVSQLWAVRKAFTIEGEAEDDNILRSISPPTTHDWLFFLMAPKWVRMRPTDAYYTVHPRSEGSAFRMSTAGSSVLLSLGSSFLDPTNEANNRKAAINSVSQQGASVNNSVSRERHRVMEASRPKPALSAIEQAISGLRAGGGGGGV
jgi:hypothetical protein